MKKETLDILNELTKKPITELAMSYMEVVADNMIKDKEIERLNKIIDELEKNMKENIDTLSTGNEAYYEKTYRLALENTLKYLKKLKEKGDE